MGIPFVKMNGAGNDFVLFDNRAANLELTPARIRWLCDRRRGIGADGVIALEADSTYDFRMRYYNSDGGEAEMCGNGARCVAWFARERGLGAGSDAGQRLHFRSEAGALEAVVGDSQVAVRMTAATGLERDIALAVAQGTEIVHFINTGVPHVIIVEPDVTGMSLGEVCERGRAVRCHERFAPAGTNVDFIARREDGGIDIRTYERGVEDETLACGTGTVAAAVVAAHLGEATSPVSVRTHGRDLLTISFDICDAGAVNVVMEGPATVNYVGSVVLPTLED